MRNLVDTAAREVLDGRIDAALGRIVARGAAHSPAAAELAAATARAARGGKRFRPELVAAAFAAWGGSPARHRAMTDVAAAVELLHAAFVVHDDVLDHDTVRRGAPNVAGEFEARGRSLGMPADARSELGVAAAVLAGDLLLHEAERTVALADLEAPARRLVLDLFDDAVHVSAAGELADIEHALAAAMPEPERLLRAAHDKTAVYSFVVPLCAGAVLGDAEETEVAALREAAAHLGLAFQLADDLVGAFGSEADAGRAAGADLREGKRTPLVALAQEGQEPELVTGALALARTGPVAVRHAQRVLDRSGARGRVRELIDDAIAAAETEGSALPPTARVLIDRIGAGIRERAL
ncbi:polyprenyl synthetase family protein [Microbacterium sp. SORGH_AS_0888]|uniref:polyprenyl synthetase family protein n=1 Tax=Microbacterium sp. SORGH_AS_0888 TaxID=3041791 RepID=UPI0027897E0D|nr:polyprenyl synthetase family protein [Microbacterium sp. SORGH_AS_0888]MDQ1128212.1 geranylgeranyl pyrophosphate synthase [Microbacterium sp. SORGH_AS_0888]